MKKKRYEAEQIVRILQEAERGEVTMRNAPPAPFSEVETVNTVRTPQMLTFLNCVEPPETVFFEQKVTRGVLFPAR